MGEWAREQKTRARAGIGAYCVNTYRKFNVMGCYLCATMPKDWGNSSVKFKILQVTEPTARHSLTNACSGPRHWTQTAGRQRPILVWCANKKKDNGEVHTKSVEYEDGEIGLTTNRTLKRA